MATREVSITMQSTAPVPTLKYGDFNPVVGTTNTTLYVLKTEANHSNSMTLLKEAGLRPLNGKEILPLLMKDETLKDSLKGKWFYLAGEGLKEDGIYTLDAKGDLEKVGSRNLSIENKVRAFKGPHPLSLDVFSDYNAAVFGGRFFLVAYYEPHYVAPVVVGVPKERPELSQAELASQVGSMLRLDEGKVLEVTFQGGVTTTFKNAISAKVLERKETKDQPSV